MIELDILNQRRGSNRVKSQNSLCLIEYEWPLESQQYNILQEHLSRFLNIKALHRRFEELERRNVENDEKQYLLENGLIHPVEANFRKINLNHNRLGCTKISANLTIFEDKIP
ncbi:hypothetical protein MXB_497 [Myxobolus squamalis]|nr:hypothetical protein MXB_497 [Myxobolus squamalis]